VAVGEGQRRAAAAAEDERPIPEVGERQARHDTGRLVGQPGVGQVADGAGEPLPVLGGDVGQHRGVVDDQGGPGRGLGGQRGQVGEQVTAVDGRRVAAGGGDRGGEPVLAVALPRPHQAGQPADVVLAGDIERVEVEPGPPGDVRHPGRQRHRAAHGAAQRRRVRVAAGDPVAVVVVAVAVEQQGQPGAGADLDQRQRAGQRGERGQQGGAAGGLVRLGAPGPHHVR